MADQPVPDPEAFEDPLSNFEPTQYASQLEQALAEAPVSEIQTQPYVEVVPSITIREAVGTLNRLNISSLLVVDQGKLVGIFTERDVLDRVAEKFDDLADSPISEVMTKEPLIVYSGDPSATALAAIAAAGYRHVPVLSETESVVGIVSPRRVFVFMEDHMGK